MIKNQLAIIIMALFLFSCASIKNSSKELNRLYDDIVPKKYYLTLWADTDKEDFKGQLIIDVELKSIKSNILVHAKDLKISSVILKSAQKEYKGDYKILNDDGLLSLDFKDVIPPGDYQLFFTYTGSYEKSLNGLYRVKEGDDYYLFTQFEPISARKMLPSFDEPRFKAPFKLAVITKKGEQVIANSPLLKKEEQDNKIAHFFEDTESLPTYLLALAIGPFDIVEGPKIRSHINKKKLISFRGIATKGKGSKLAFAMKESPQILEKLESYFGVAYPFKKLDILAVPDFNAGAMENAGAITFREWLLLLDEKNASIEQKQKFYEVMAHELAHQWFGNMVTMPWWDDIWLNEAFATWLSFKIVDQIKPEYKLKNRLKKSGYEAMAKDSTSAARKIREDIISTHDIYNAFDHITYLKGGAVLSMWENYLGEKQFRKAVSHHIKRFPYGVASYQDFLTTLAAFSKPDLIKSAESYLNQPGFPMVELSYECKNQHMKVTATQKRYVPMGSKASKNGSWHVPLCIGYPSNGLLKKHCHMLTKQSEHFLIQEKNCPLYVVPNYNGQGYYRFALNEKDWQNLIKANKALNEQNRMALADSLMGGLKLGDLSFAFVAEGLSAMIDKKAPYGAERFMSLMAQAQEDWILPQEKPKLMAYATDALLPLYQQLKQSQKLKPNELILKYELANFFVYILNDQNIRQDLKQLGQSYYEGILNKGQPQTDDELMVGDALALVLQEKDEPSLKKIMTHLKNEGDAVVRTNIIKALSLARDKEEAMMLREFTLDKSLRQNEFLSFFKSHLKKAVNQPATWSFVKNNITSLKKNLNKSSAGDLPFLATGLCSKESALEVEAFFKPFIKDYEGGPRNVAETCELIGICAAQKEHCAPQAAAYFGSKTAVVTR